MREITSHIFDSHIRASLLNSGHEFNTEKLDRVRNLFNHALVESKHTTLEGRHFDDALKHMENHPDWDRLTERQRNAVVSTFKKHLGIEEKASTEAANDSEFRKAA